MLHKLGIQRRDISRFASRSLAMKRAPRDAGAESRKKVLSQKRREKSFRLHFTARAAGTEKNLFNHRANELVVVSVSVENKAEKPRQLLAPSVSGLMKLVKLR
jgi:hypothetical protein